MLCSFFILRRKIAEDATSFAINGSYPDVVITCRVQGLGRPAQKAKAGNKIILFAGKSNAWRRAHTICAYLDGKQ